MEDALDVTWIEYTIQSTQLGFVNYYALIR